MLSFQTRSSCRKINLRKNLRKNLLSLNLIPLSKVLTDFAERSRWDTNFEKSTVLEQLDASSKVVYFALRCACGRIRTLLSVWGILILQNLCCRGQLGISARDLVERVTVYPDCAAASGAHVVVYEGVEHGSAPEREGYLRAHTFMAGYVIREHPQSNGSSHVMCVTHCDPRGSLPTSLIETMAAKEPIRQYPSSSHQHFFRVRVGVRHPSGSHQHFFPSPVPSDRWAAYVPWDFTPPSPVVLGSTTSSSKSASGPLQVLREALCPHTGVGRARRGNAGGQHLSGPHLALRLPLGRGAPRVRV